MSLQIFRPRRRAAGPLMADLREVAGVVLVFAAIAALEALLRHFGVVT